MTTVFSELFEYVKKMRSRYLLVLSAFNIFNCLGDLLAYNKSGKRQALKNQKTMQSFGYFFQTTKEACRCLLLIELAKFFDKPNGRYRSLTVYEVLDYSKNHIGKLTKEHFKEYHRGRKILEELFDDYKPLSLADIRKMENKIAGLDLIIKEIKNYRDKYLAHDDLDKIKVDIKKKDIQSILNLLKSFIELYYSRLDFASNSYKNFTDNPYDETKRIIEHLQNYEKYQLEKINKRLNN